jgi:hypothetical protein
MKVFATEQSASTSNLNQTCNQYLRVCQRHGQTSTRPTTNSEDDLYRLKLTSRFRCLVLDFATSPFINLTPFLGMPHSTDTVRPARPQIAQDIPIAYRTYVIIIRKIPRSAAALHISILEVHPNVAKPADAHIMATTTNESMAMVWLPSGFIRGTSNAIGTHPFNTRTTSSNALDCTINSKLKRDSHVVNTVRCRWNWHTSWDCTHQADHKSNENLYNGTLTL